MSEGIRAPKTTRHLDHLTAVAKSGTGIPPIAELIGMRLVEADLGRSEIEMHAEKRHTNPMGTLHGGVICDLSDLAMGVAMASTLEDDESFTTLDLTSKFWKPIWNGRLRARATVTKRTRTLGLVECDVLDDGGSLVAKVFSSCIVLRGQDAKGR